ncbi:MAG: CysS/YqeB C-terminal domain-containing protein [Acidimicrobiales bacterium]
MIDARTQDRADKRWADGDAIRDRLVSAGVLVHDTPEGTEWELA